jgi:hypothetical protein
MTGFTFLPDAIFNLELPSQYWFALKESVGAMRDLIDIYSGRRAAS